MALNIKDAQTEKAIRDLAAATGEGLTAAVKGAVEEKLRRVRRHSGGRGLRDEILAIGAHCASLPVLDDRTADEILGYDENGLPN
jgi:antitoxin VapB